MGFDHIIDNNYNRHATQDYLIKMSRKKSQRLVYVFIIFGAFALILSMIANNSSFAGDWSTVTNAYIGTIPYLGIMGIGLYFGLTGKSKFLGTALLFGLLGIINAGLFNYLNDQKIWIDAYVNTTTAITDIMLITIIVWLIFGFILGAIKR